MKMSSSQLWLQFKRSQIKPEKCFRGFSRIRTRGQLSYEDPYAGSRPITTEMITSSFQLLYCLLQALKLKLDINSNQVKLTFSLTYIAPVCFKCPFYWKRSAITTCNFRFFREQDREKVTWKSWLCQEHSLLYNMGVLGFRVMHS